MNNSFKKLSIPYIVWLFIFALLPVLVMFIMTFLDMEDVSFLDATFTFGNFGHIIEPSTSQAFFNSIKFAFLSTAISLVIGYIIAYRVFRSKFSNKFLILTVLILPMWSNLLLRTEALGNVMEPNNILADLFSRIGITLNINIKGTGLAVLIGLVFTYLPFMVLPIYTALEKIDYSLEEAAVDLGASDTKKFWKVIFPLSMKGIVAGSIMVFLPTMSGFAIPEILGQGNILLIGNIIQQDFLYLSYNLGALLAIIILIVILGSLIILSKIDKEGETLL